MNEEKLNEILELVYQVADTQAEAVGVLESAKHAIQMSCWEGARYEEMQQQWAQN